MRIVLTGWIVASVCITHAALAADSPPGLTSLGNPAVEYRVAEKPYLVLRRGKVEVVIVDNREVNDAVLPGHHEGYSGVASLKHAKRQENLFVPAFAGLNFEHIHDGTVQPMSLLFEPRKAPMELRRVDEHTAELYQAPTPHWGLESCHRYRLLDDGTIEMVFECIPRRAAFKNGYLGLFWASYIHRPESLDIHFKGSTAKGEGRPDWNGLAAKGGAAAEWIRGVTPAHGVLATHRALEDNRDFAHDPKFPLTLVFGDSRHRYAQPWYFGVSHGMALAQMFRPADRVRLSQSPNGAGGGNPAWDFQYFIAAPEVGKRYQLVMRAMYMPYESAEQVQRGTAPHRTALTGP